MQRPTLFYVVLKIIVGVGVNGIVHGSAGSQTSVICRVCLIISEIIAFRTVRQQTTRRNPQVRTSCTSGVLALKSARHPLIDQTAQSGCVRSWLSAHASSAWRRVTVSVLTASALCPAARTSALQRRLHRPAGRHPGRRRARQGRCAAPGHQVPGPHPPDDPPGPPPLTGAAAGIGGRTK